MFNPLLPDLTTLKDTELEEKVRELTGKYYSALRLGMGSSAHQIVVALEQYREELYKRQQAAVQKVMNKQNKDMDGLINVD